MKYKGLIRWRDAATFAFIFLVMWTPELAARESTSREEQEQPSLIRVSSSQEISFNAIRRNSTRVKTEATAILHDASQARHWANAIVALGFVGDASMVPTILENAAELRGEVSADVYEALLRTPIALGHLANAGSELALAVLLGQVDKSSKPQWTYLHVVGGPPSRLEYAAINGLAIAAGPTAVARLRTMMQVTNSQLYPEKAQLLKDALHLSDRINTQGLTAIFTRREHVLSLVQRDYVHGVPYSQARMLNTDDVLYLAMALQDRSRESSWPNVVDALGIIGSSEAFEPLLVFFESQDGEVSPSTFRALLQSLRALGHLALRGSDESFATLCAYASRQGSLPRFSYGGHRNEGLLDPLQRFAIQALGVSARPEAQQFLQALRQSPDFPAELEDNVAEALDAIERIRRDGADKVFGGQQ